MKPDLVQLDKAHVWHPFTQMKDWMNSNPIVLQSGKGAVLKDIHGKKYLDANSSIWTNLHGHNHPKINAAIRAQLKKVAHTSALGFANEPATLLAARLVQIASLKTRAEKKADLKKVFFSDDGSTAMEVALKLAYVHSLRTGISSKPRFISMQGSYHGDTVGAVSLGHIDLFHKAYSGMLFKSDSVMAPYCYRCPFNQTSPEQGDARGYRKCHWECIDAVEKKCTQQRKSRGEPHAAFVFEPLMQGAAGMIPQPEGWLNRIASIVRGHGSLLIADEVMTGFGRTGHVVASHQEGVQPDFIALAKGLSGGYLPMAATLTTESVFNSFLGDYSEFKTFFHGHSFTGNQLGAAAGLASLDILESASSLENRQRLTLQLETGLRELSKLEHVGDVRQQGLVAGVELVKDWHQRTPYDLREKAGIKVCEEMSSEGVLTRSIGNVIVLMPPYCTTSSQLQKILDVLKKSIRKVLGGC